MPVAYDNLSDLFRDTLDRDDADRVIAKLESRDLVRSLVVTRVSREITQAEMAERMKCSQAKISKIERGKDFDLTLGEVVEFARQIGKSIKVVIGEGEGLSVEMKGGPRPSGRRRVRK